MMDQRYTHIFAILQQEIEKPDSIEWFTWKVLLYILRVKN